jgi:hypothetical protein
MPDAVRELYSQRRYPALSHPEMHPGVLHLLPPGSASRNRLALSSADVRGL